MANKNNYTAGEYFLLLVVTGLFIGYIYTANSILNYPEYLHYYGIGFSFFLVLLIDIKPAIKRCAPLKRWYEQYYAVGLTLMSWVLISIITGTIILIPFNYYDKSQSKNSSSETFDC